MLLFHQEEALDIVLNACEKFPWDSSRIAQYIKTQLDDRLGASWHVAAGEAFSFELAFEGDSLLYLFYGSLGIVAWKCGTVLLSEVNQDANPRRERFS